MGILFQPAQRKQHPDHETRLVVHQLDRAAVRADDPLCDGKTKPAATARTAAVQLEERFEQLDAVLGGDAGPAIRDLDAQLVAGPISPSLDSATGLAMAKSVVNQYHEQLAKAVAVDQGLDSRIGLDIEPTAATGRERLEIRAGRDDEPADVSRLPAKHRLTDIDAGQRKEIVNQPRHTLSLG